MISQAITTTVTDVGVKLREWAKKNWKGIIFVIALVVVVFLPLLSWNWLRKGAQAQETNATTLRNLLLMSGVVIGIPLAAWRSWTAHKQTETTNKQADIAERGLNNERYQRGAEMLGSQALSVRLGGIYALERLAQEHPGEYHIQIMDLFSAFVRHPIPDSTLDSKETESSPSTDKSHEYKKIRADLQEAVRAVGRRSAEQIKVEEKHSYYVNFIEAIFASAKLEWVNLTNADLTGAYLTGAILTDANLTGANFYKADLINADLAGANLTRANFYEADLLNAKLHDANLAGANLMNTNLTEANLLDANLTEAYLYKAYLYKAELIGTNLTGAKLIGADLTEAEFIGADLTEASFQGGSLKKTIFSEVNLTGADLRSAVGLMQEHLDTAVQHPDGRPPSLPKGYKWDEVEAKKRWPQ